MATSAEFKHGLRLQLSDVKKLLEFLEKETPDTEEAIKKLHEMQQILTESLQD